MVHRPIGAQEHPEQPTWYCSHCERTVKAEQVIRRQWGQSVAVICPTCEQRLGEIRYSDRERVKENSPAQ